MGGGAGEGPCDGEVGGVEKNRLSGDTGEFSTLPLNFDISCFTLGEAGDAEGGGPGELEWSRGVVLAGGSLHLLSGSGAGT